MNTNKVNLTLEITTTPFRINAGRGRPQSNPQVNLDLSEAGSLLEAHGEKLVRLAAFRAAKEQLGVDAACVIAEHPKTAGSYVLKSAALGKVDVNIIVRSGPEAEVVATETAETVSEASTEA